MPTRRAKPAKKLWMALQLIEALATDWNPNQYHDTYTEELRKLIEAKEKGEESSRTPPTRPRFSI